ncbi:HASPIN protein kinase [Paracoccidioides brasiliensis]|uniref:non-specific serine/threonine protein kinase n=1 Tax=Paracoccidioides brasiliensis TaxID=121759 RepID=A0A1D2J2Q9_PARBR|nr:HASPIN protein kinase [Paracoccidioides brasiliensis]
MRCDISLLSPSASPKKPPRSMNSSMSSTCTRSITAVAATPSTRKVYGKGQTIAARAVLERDINNHVLKRASAAGRKQERIESAIDNMITAVSALQVGAGNGTTRRLNEQREEEVNTSIKLQADTEEEREQQQPIIKLRTLEAQTQEQEQTNPKANPKRKPRRSSGRIEDIKLTDYVRPILNEATSPISSRGIQRFASWSRRAGDMFTVEKIAEGSYGEVYQMRFRNADIPSERNNNNNLSKSRMARLKAYYRDGVFKIIPVRAQRGVGSKKFTSVSEIVAEVQLLKLLDPIPGFARFREVHVVQGRFPEAYQQAWMRYSQTNKGENCLNPDPSKAKSYPDTQLWAVLEMDNAGVELERFEWGSACEAYDIFWGVALALARAEQFAAFEHRDLHLGNICIKPTKNRISTVGLPKSINAALQGDLTGFGLSGLETTIIDYSLSRAELQPEGDLNENESQKKHPVVEIAWSDLDQRQIFGAVGRDEDEKLLRDTYRYMRSQVYHQDDLLSPTQPATKPGQWKNYNPRTNLIWLSFLLQMLMKKTKPSPCPFPRPAPGQRQQQQPQQQPQQQRRRPLTQRPANRKLDNNILINHGNSPCKTLKNEKKTQQPHVTRDDENGNRGEKAGSGVDVDLDIAWRKLEEELGMRLQTTAEMLSVQCGIEELCSAGDLVAVAIGAGWLGEGDFLC